MTDFWKGLLEFVLWLLISVGFVFVMMIIFDIVGK